MAKKRYVYENVEVIKIVDGDTIDVMIDLGFNVWQKVRVRLYGINAPEVKGESKAEGKKSTEFLKELLPLNSFIKMECVGKDKYGRWLGDLYLEDLFINEYLIEQGYAEKYME